jgi:integrase/recombinase XerD
MLTIYRRHLKSCKHRDEGRAYRHCHCPIWVDGFLGGEEMRESLNLRDWQKAHEKIQEWVAKGKVEPEPEAEPITIENACAEFMEDATARALKPPTLYKYRLLFRRLQDFSKAKGMRYITEFDLPKLRAFRASWTDHNLSAMKNLERLRAFFGFVRDSGWSAENVAKKIKNPKVSQCPTLPFTRDQVANILAACGDYPDRSHAPKVRALVLLLRYSGLRIRDGVTLHCDRIRDGKLFLRTAKTGTVVQCPLPPFVIEALESITGKGLYFFWSGESNPKSCVGDWQRSLKRLFRLAGVPDGHAHRFRDTFAVELLLSGVPLERVSILLGHQSVKVTEKHYSPWVAARQEQLDADVRRTWSEDLLVVSPNGGTYKVHGKETLPN